MQSVIVIVAAGALFGVVHSLLAADAVKTRLSMALGRWTRLVYNAIAGLTLLPALALVPLLPDAPLYRVPSPWRWALVVLQLAAAGLAAWPFIQTDVWRFLGLRQLMQTEPLALNNFQRVGMYRWVRHPAYFFSLVFLWASPVMTRNQMTLYIIFSLYLWVGALFEERKLLRHYPAYAAYRRQVPMLIPWKPSLWWAGQSVQTDEAQTS